MRVACYARVSTGRQQQAQTIEQQVGLLRAYVGARPEWVLREEHIFRDDGYTGARLQRPGLDALRDHVARAEFDVVVITAPDRLARHFVHQMVVLEEWERAGIQVVFIDRPPSHDPHEQLLLQIQGAIAEYERALLGERFRRGKLQKARAGQYLSSRPPYGYRYIPKREGVPGHLVIDEAEASIVRMLYRWLVDERLTLRRILKRLNFGPWFPRSGKHPWSPSVVHRVLADPTYTGTAYAHRYAYTPPRKPRAARGPRSGQASCRQRRPREEWIPIPVPAIVDQATFDQAIVGDDALEIRHVIPLDPPSTTSIGPPAEPDPGLRSDGVRAAALPARALQHGGDGALEPLVRIAGHQPDAAQPARHQRAQEGQPERAILTRPHVQAQDLALALGVDAHRDDHRHAHHAPAVAHFQEGPVHP
jgi:DNA invertase Pin-like site-specific DNA recombinase